MPLPRLAQAEEPRGWQVGHDLPSHALVVLVFRKAWEKSVLQRGFIQLVGLVPYIGPRDRAGYSVQAQTVTREVSANRYWQV